MIERIEMFRIANLLGRLYFQYVIIIAIAVFFAYALNIIFTVDDTEVRIMLSSVFLALFAGSVLFFGRLKPGK
jgi:hypothetical protein